MEIYHRDMFDVIWDMVEDTTDDDLHPGPKAHKQYAERLKMYYKIDLSNYEPREVEAIRFQRL